MNNGRTYYQNKETSTKIKCKSMEITLMAGGGSAIAVDMLCWRDGEPRPNNKEASVGIAVWWNLLGLVAGTVYVSRVCMQTSMRLEARGFGKA